MLNHADTKSCKKSILLVLKNLDAMYNAGIKDHFGFTGSLISLQGSAMQASGLCIEQQNILDLRSQSPLPTNSQHCTSYPHPPSSTSNHHTELFSIRR